MVRLPDASARAWIGRRGLSGLRRQTDDSRPMPTPTEPRLLPGFLRPKGLKCPEHPTRSGPWGLVAWLPIINLLWVAIVCGCHGGIDRVPCPGCPSDSSVAMRWKLRCRVRYPAGASFRVVLSPLVSTFPSSGGLVHVPGASRDLCGDSPCLWTCPWRSVCVEPFLPSFLLQLRPACGLQIGKERQTVASFCLPLPPF